MANDIHIIHYVLEILIGIVGTLTLFILKSLFGTLKEIKDELKENRLEMKEIKEILNVNGNRMTAMETTLKYMEFHILGTHRHQKAQGDDAP